MLPPIVVSAVDARRLELLVGRLAARDPAGVALARELDRADIAEPWEMPPTVVTMNSTVRFVLEDTREEFTLTLAYPKDCADGQDCLSILSPVGTALLGLAAGDVIEWPTPAGALISLRVLEVIYQPERAGNFTA
jgi:regulator of nucleoside diphosphate kinase